MAQVAQRARLDRAAVADDADAVAQGLDLGEDVARQQHRAALLAFLLDDLLEGGLHERVEAGGRFVEHEQVHAGREGGDDGDLLPVALRIGAALLLRVEVEALDQVRAAAFVEPAAQAAEQVDHLAAGQVGPEVDVPGHVGEAAVECRRVAPGVAAEQADVPGVGPQEAEQDADGGRLARAVRAQEAVHLTGGDLQVEAVEGPRRAERLPQARDGDGVVHGGEATLNSQTCEVRKTSRSSENWRG